ncbi:MAG: hypothetical protein DRJ46_04910 [Thermoprotei archaeon]|nr:MAG: hypothetical protein DRJ46_04910 [Thermoprotei archaeon]
MAKYNLIIKNSTYVKAMQLALKKEMSLGKLFNKAIEEYINRELNRDPVKEILEDKLFHELFTEVKQNAIKHFGEIPEHIMETWYDIYKKRGRDVEYSDFRKAIEQL